MHTCAPAPWCYITSSLAFVLFMALNGLLCADMPLNTYTCTVLQARSVLVYGGRAHSQGGPGGPCPPRNPSAPSVFAEQWHKAQLSQFSLRHSTLLTITFFQNVVFIQICQFCAHTGQKNTFFCLPEVRCDPRICQNSKMPFQPGLRPWPHWGSSRRPRSPSRLGRGHPSPDVTPLSALTWSSPKPGEPLMLYFTTKTTNNLTKYDPWVTSAVTLIITFIIQRYEHTDQCRLNSCENCTGCGRTFAAATWAQ